MKKHLLTLTSVSVAFTMTGIFSSATAQTTTTDVERLTVTGSRLALGRAELAAVSTVIDQQEIARSGALQLTDLLRALPGVTIAQSGGSGALTEIRLRGSETNHLLVVIDGVIANDIGQGSTIDLAHLSAANIARIELLRGAQSALWGSGAVAGVLNITTTAALNNGSRVQAKVGAGTQGTTTGSASAGGQDGALQFNAYANWLNTDGDNIALTGNEDDGYRNITTGGSLRWQADDAHTVSANVRLVDYASDFDAIDAITTGLPIDADNVTDGKQINALLGWIFSPQKSAYSSTVHGSYRKDENDSVAAKRYDGGTTGERFQLTWLNRYTYHDWQIAGGLEYLTRQFSQRGLADFGDPNQQQQDHTSSVFAEIGGPLVSDVVLSLSGRFDNNTEFDNAFSYRAGVNWAVNDAYSVFTSVSQAVKTPSFTERFGYYPQTFVGNPDLKPETSQQWEAGARAVFTSALQGQLSFFSTQLEDEINGYVYNPETFITTAENRQTDSEREGVEAEFTYQHNDLTVRSSYSYIDTQQAGDDELRRANHQAAVSVLAPLPINGVSFYAKVAYTGTRKDIFYPPYPATAQTVNLSAYTIVDVNLTYPISDSWSATLRVDNLLDETYQDIVGFSAQERRAVLSVNWQL